MRGVGGLLPHCCSLELSALQLCGVGEGFQQAMISFCEHGKCCFDLLHEPVCGLAAARQGRVSFLLLFPRLRAPSFQPQDRVRGGAGVPFPERGKVGPTQWPSCWECDSGRGCCSCVSPHTAVPMWVLAVGVWRPFWVREDLSTAPCLSSHFSRARGGSRERGPPGPAEAAAAPQSSPGQ